MGQKPKHSVKYCWKYLHGLYPYTSKGNLWYIVPVYNTHKKRGRQA